MKCAGQFVSYWGEKVARRMRCAGQFVRYWGEKVTRRMRCAVQFVRYWGEEVAFCGETKGNRTFGSLRCRWEG